MTWLTWWRNATLALTSCLAAYLLLTSKASGTRLGAQHHLFSSAAGSVFSRTSGLSEAAAATANGCPRWVEITPGGKRADACESRAVTNLHLVNAGAAGWRAYAERVKSTVERRLADPTLALSNDTARQIVDEAHAAAQLWTDIETTQNVANPATDCKSARVLLLQYPNNGFASAFGFFGGALMQAHARKRILIFDEGSVWNYGAGPQHCPDLASTGQWGCYFQPVGNCNYRNAGISADELKASKSVEDDGGTSGGLPSCSVYSTLQHWLSYF